MKWIKSRNKHTAWRDTTRDGMGCDIHMTLEMRHNGKWVGLHTFDYLPSEAFDMTDFDGDNLVKPGRSSPFLFWKVRSRNYALFGKLAGVRTEELGMPEREED